jgi:hypothetical protein
VVVPSDRFMKVLNGEPIPGDAIATLQEMSGDGAAEDLLMAGDVVRVGVGNEGKGFGAWGIEPQVERGEM